MFKYFYKGEEVEITGDLGDHWEIKDPKSAVIIVQKSQVGTKEEPDKPPDAMGSGLTTKSPTSDAGDSGEGNNATMDDVHPERL